MEAAAKYLRIGLAACCALWLAGCAGVRMPDWFHPGPAGYQRYNALQYDPYPLNDVAPPVEGARPREYARQIPEVKRGQMFAPRPAAMQPIPWPTFSLPDLSNLVAPSAAVPAPVAPAAPAAPAYHVRPPY